MAGLAEFTNTVLDFVRLHPNWAALIVFVLAFGELLAFVSLILPFWAMLVGIGTIIGAADRLIFWTIVTAPPSVRRSATGSPTGWATTTTRRSRRCGRSSRYPKLLPRTATSSSSDGASGRS